MEKEEEIIEQLVHLNCHDATFKESVLDIEKEFNCKVSIEVHKENSLQYSYYYALEFNGKGILNIEIESGINNGTLVNSVEWSTISTTPTSKEVRALVDLVFSESKFNDWFLEKDGDLSKKAITRERAIALFNNKKDELLVIKKNQSYDNYVTGGGTVKTDSYYKNSFSEIASKGVFYEFLYEEIDVDVNVCFAV